MQVYHLGIDDKTRKPSLNVRYEIQKDGKLVIDIPEDDLNLRAASQQFTAARNIPLRELAPGKYTARIRVADNVTNQSISPSATFELR